MGLKSPVGWRSKDSLFLGPCRRVDDLTHLTDTERALLDGVLAGAIDITKLGRKARIKLEQYMEKYVQWLTITEADYKQILNRVHNFLKYPKIDLRAGKIDYDELPAIKPTLPAWVSNAFQLFLQTELSGWDLKPLLQRRRHRLTVFLPVLPEPGAGLRLLVNEGHLLRVPFFVVFLWRCAY